MRLALNIRFLDIGHRVEKECSFRRKPAIWSLRDKRCSSYKLRRAVTPNGKQMFYCVHPAFFTDGADVNINTADPEQLFLPGLPFVVFFYQFNTAE